MQSKNQNSFNTIRKQIQNKEEFLLNALNIEVSSKQNEGTPCPNCGGNDRFSWCYKGEQWLYNCRHCEGGDLFNLITKMHGNDPQLAAKVIQQALGSTPNIITKPAPTRQLDPKQVEAQAKAQTTAQQLMESAVQHNDHPYLENKGLHGVSVLTLGSDYKNKKFTYPKGSIVLPITNGEKVVSVQLINDEGCKGILADSQYAGGFHVLEGTEPSKIYLAEGFATGLSIYEAFNRKESIVISFSTSNLKKVAEHFRKTQALPLVFMADNDQNKVGEKAARKAATQYEPVYMPPSVGDDWDDYRQQGHDIKEEVLRLEQAYLDQQEQELHFEDVKEGKPLATQANLSGLLIHHKMKAVHNSMNLSMELMKNNKIIQNSQEQNRSMLISKVLKAGLPKSAIEDHIVALSENEAYHPIKQWLEDGEWDRVERVQPIIDVLQTKNPEATSAIMNKWLVGCIAALYEAHFHLKLVPVLQGEQSYMKTAFISRIATVTDGSFLEGAELNPDVKDSILSCICSWIVELGELERTSKNSQGSLKAFITKSVDTVRPPYARSDVKKKRQTTFIATVNGTDFLRDETGSSRYGVIELTGPVDMERVNQILGWTYTNGRLILKYPEKLKQFWLEVKSMYDNGASWHLTSEEQVLIASINSQYTHKSNVREDIEQILADANSSSPMGWFLARNFCIEYGWLNVPTVSVGKALSNLAKEGLIKVRDARGNKKEYYLPKNIFIKS